MSYDSKIQMELDGKDRMDARHIPFFRLVFDRVYCPECKSRMKKVDSPFEVHWKCPECNWVTWYSPKK